MTTDADPDEPATARVPGDVPGDRGPGTFALLTAAVVLLLGAAALLLTGTGDDGTVATDRPFTYFDGTEGSFADYAGRPLVVNFWASTCTPCVKEMPAFETVHQRRDDVAFLGIDVQERVEDGLEMVATTGVTYDLASDFDGQVLYETSQAAGLPTTAFIDASGRVLDTHLGALDEDELEARIDELLTP